MSARLVANNPYQNSSWKTTPCCKSTQWNFMAEWVGPPILLLKGYPEQKTVTGLANGNGTRNTLAAVLQLNLWSTLLLFIFTSAFESCRSMSVSTAILATSVKSWTWLACVGVASARGRSTHYVTSLHFGLSGLDASFTVWFTWLLQVWHQLFVTSCPTGRAKVKQFWGWILPVFPPSFWGGCGWGNITGGGDSSVVTAPDSWLKGHGFESLLEWRDNFLLQGRLSVLTLISVSIPPPCYHSST